MALIRKAYQIRNYGKSWINVEPTGLIRISKRLALSMNISIKDSVAFYQDDKNSLEWYIAKEEAGLTVNQSGSCFKVHSTVIANEILISIGAIEKKVKIMVSVVKDTNKMFAIITSSATDLRGNKI